MPRCTICGYDRGEFNRCPECGSTALDEEVHVHRRVEARVVCALGSFWTGIVAAPVNGLLFLVYAMGGSDQTTLHFWAGFLAVVCIVLGLCLIPLRFPWPVAACSFILAGATLAAAAFGVVRLWWH